MVATTALRAGQERLAELVPWLREVYAAHGPAAGDLLAVAPAAAGQEREAREFLEGADRCGRTASSRSPPRFGRDDPGDAGGAGGRRRAVRGPAALPRRTAALLLVHRRGPARRRHPR
ncbi:hypothetical protein GCM10010343_59320 [Streptomyces avidinii]|nr:hypothetical protein GCM10010343_59320 [Streptomyces avidinii]